MIASLKNDNLILEIKDPAKKIFKDAKHGKVLFTLRPIYEFALQIECEAYCGIITSNHCEREYAERENEIFVVYRHKLFDLHVCYSIDEDAAYKKMHLVAKKQLKLRYAQTEVSKTVGNLSRGGEGQPIFVEDKAFISIIFPAAQNYIDGDVIRLEQAPFICLEEGETFEFFPVVYGLSAEKTVQKSFVKYIEKHKRKTPAGLRIYSDWGAHDESANEAQLDEKMALRLVGTLRKAKAHGIAFDYYLMDDQWFEASKGYQSFKNRTWPQGQQQFLSELNNAGIKFGQWFDVSMERLKLSDYVPRLEEDKRRVCFSYEDTAKILFDGIKTQINQSGCKMLKLDFAFFLCGSTEHSVHASQGVGIKEPAIRNFINGLTEIYRENPDLVVLGYNGFTVDLECISSIDNNYRKYMISPWWSLYINYLYCGDPRLSEMPTERLGDSLIYYTDGMMKGFEESLMPFSAIDDHGTMVGNTNTIYYLGKGSYRDSWIMNISRGSKRMLLYGELALFGDEDWKFISESQEMFDFICQESVETELILGNPRYGKRYGYSNCDECKGYFTLVNPEKAEATVLLERDEWKHKDAVRIRKYYSEGAILNERFAKVKDRVMVSLAPNSVTVYQWEEENSIAPFREGYVVLEKDSCESILLPNTCTEFTVLLQDDTGSPQRVFGRGEEPVVLECLTAGVKVDRMNKKPVWSGASWVTYQVIGNVNGQNEIHIQLRNRGANRLYVKWFENEGAKVLKL